MTLKKTHGTPIVDALHDVVALEVYFRKVRSLAVEAVVNARVNVYSDKAHQDDFDPVSTYNTGEIFGLDVRGDLIAQVEAHLKAGVLVDAEDVAAP